MEGGGFSPNPNYGSFSDTSMDLDVMEELLLDGCWLEAKDGNIQDPSASSSSPTSVPNDVSLLFNLSDSRTGSFGTNPHQKIPEETLGNLTSSLVYPKIEDAAETQLKASAQSTRFLVEESDSGKSWWIGPKANAGPSSSPVKDRLVQAIENLQVAMQDKDFLIQIWVPVKKEGKNFLTTEKQPHSFNRNYLSLERYRQVSEGYNFPADGDSKESVGLPGRVFLGKLPEWTPDVRFFKSEEYPRIKFARKYDVCGSLALPVFERGSGTCLGVVEIVTTTQKINYRPELEDVCRALEAVDLRSSNNSNPLSLEFPHVSDELYQTELPRISEMLESICRSHGLPLALTWAPCFRQGKSGSRHSEENYSHCVSTIDSACFVPDQDTKNFLEACSEHHLLLGEGIVGRAFKTYKQCFATDVTAFSKTNYPLAHHAKIFGLHAGLAIPLRSLYSGSVELVLELFFPKDCLETEKQKKMLNLLTTTLQQNFKSLYLVMDKELEEEVILPVREAAVFSDANQEHQKKLYSSTSKGTSPEESSWIAHMMEANRKGKGVLLSWEFQKEEPKEEFKLTWDNRNSQIVSEGKDVFFDPRKFQQNRGKFGVDGGGKSSYLPGCRQIPGRRRTKTEKTIGLEVLRQYFAGSLKDAAKSIGVCPTTLKRICRQHGISRWPSRKIKKVGHSLQKLQLVIDSVQGVQGSIQLGSFYTSFPELGSPSFPAAAAAGPSSNPNENSKQLKNPQHPNSTSSSGSSTCCSTGANQNLEAGKPPPVAGIPTGLLPRPHSDAELVLQAANQEESRNLSRNWSQKTLNTRPDLEILPPVPSTAGKIPKQGNSVKIKACLGEGKVRFTFPTQNCSFADLQKEVKTRFSINDMQRFDLKYLDDDLEWVLLTCDADLDECIDIYRSPSMQNHTIKIAVQLASQTKLGGSFGSSCPF